jgi:hypothetical protein
LSNFYLFHTIGIVLNAENYRYFDSKVSISN